jgi:hypothetical protein
MNKVTFALGLGGLGLALVRGCSGGGSERIPVKASSVTDGADERHEEDRHDEEDDGRMPEDSLGV